MRQQEEDGRKSVCSDSTDPLSHVWIGVLCDLKGQGSVWSHRTSGPYYVQAHQRAYEVMPHGFISPVHWESNDRKFVFKD